MHWIASAFSKRKTKVPKGPSHASRHAAWIQTLWTQKERGLGGIFLLLAVAMGMWANEWSEQEAILKWEKTHLPSLKVIQHALESRGMVWLRDSAKIHRCLKSLPTSVDEKGAFWLHDKGWVVFFSQTPEMLIPQLYCLNCHEIGGQWSSMGRGWSGFENTMVQLDQRMKSLRLLPKNVAPAVFLDPRAILY
jgi:hypothetical protein